MDGNALSDSRYGIPGEIGVWHWIQIEGVGGHDEVRERLGVVHYYIFLLDPVDSGLHEGFRIHCRQIFRQSLQCAFAGNAAFIQKFPNKPGADVLIRQRLRGFVHQVDHIGAAVPQDFGKVVVLLLCDLQERDIIEQKTFKVFRHQALYLVVDAVDQDFVQPSDLRKIMNSRFHFQYLSFHISNNYLSC